MVNCPVACSLTIMNTKPGTPPPPPAGGDPVVAPPDAGGGGGGGGGGDDAGGGGGDEEEEKDCDNIYNGCGLTTAEKNAMLDLTCDTTVKGNDDFGVPTAGRPNYMLLIGKCPMNCHEKGDKKVLGVGIHPAEASICKSAIYD